MARDEHDREDLMREASGLNPRAEIHSPRLAQNLVFGFKPQGGLSLFFGVQPVYQFNSAGEFRRGFIDGRLFKAVNGSLVSLERERTAQEVTLWTKQLPDADAKEILRELTQYLERTKAILVERDFQLVAEYPDQSRSIELLRQFLELLRPVPVIATRANST